MKFEKPRPRFVVYLILLTLMLALGFEANREGAFGQSMPASEGDFVAAFKAGDYGHAPKTPTYSKAFKRMYVYKYRRQIAKHGLPKWFTSKRPMARLTDITDTDIWKHEHNVDTCGGYNPPNWFSVECRMTKSGDLNLQKLVASPYWKRRGELQNKWTARVAWCGGIGLVEFFSGGTATAVLGRGAAYCTAGFIIP